MTLFFNRFYEVVCRFSVSVCILTWCVWTPPTKRLCGNGWITDSCGASASGATAARDGLLTRSRTKGEGVDRRCGDLQRQSKTMRRGDLICAAGAWLCLALQRRGNECIAKEWQSEERPRIAQRRQCRGVRRNGRARRDGEKQRNSDELLCKEKQRKCKERC